MGALLRASYTHERLLHGSGSAWESHDAVMPSGEELTDRDKRCVACLVLPAPARLRVPEPRGQQGRKVRRGGVTVMER
jgi:hypothetical protein